MADTLTHLEATIASRAGADPSSSYVAALLGEGTPRIARKLGEEAIEMVIAALSGDRPAIVGEAADLLFHLLVLLRATGVPFADVLAELERREGTSGIAEKASRRSEAPLAIDPAIEPMPEPALAFGRAAARPLIRKG